MNDFIEIYNDPITWWVIGAIGLILSLIAIRSWWKGFGKPETSEEIEERTIREIVQYSDHDTRSLF